jgi:hypothetical protein
MFGRGPKWEPLRLEKGRLFPLAALLRVSAVGALRAGVDRRTARISLRTRIGWRTRRIGWRTRRIGWRTGGIGLRTGLDGWPGRITLGTRLGGRTGGIGL